MPVLVASTTGLHGPISGPGGHRSRSVRGQARAALALVVATPRANAPEGNASPGTQTRGDSPIPAGVHRRRGTTRGRPWVGSGASAGREGAYHEKQICAASACYRRCRSRGLIPVRTAGRIRRSQNARRSPATPEWPHASYDPAVRVRTKGGLRACVSADVAGITVETGR